MKLKSIVLTFFLISSGIFPYLPVEAQEGGGSFGYIGANWTNLKVIEESNYLEVQGIDANFTMRFYNGTQGYNTIMKNGSVLVQDERWFLEYPQGQWKPRGIPQNVYYEIISEVNVKVIRTYTDFINTNWNITYILFGGSMPKIMFNGTLAEDEYRIRWALSGINKNYYEQDVNKIKLYNSTEDPFYVDYQDVFDSKGNITEVDYGGWGNNKIDVNFNIGLVSGYYGLDPSFGETAILGNTGGQLNTQIRAIRFNLTQTGCVDSMSFYHAAGNFILRLLIYNDTGLYTTPNEILGRTLDTTINAGGWQWSTISLQNSITLPNGTYWLSWQNNETVNGKFAAGSANQQAFNGAVTWPTEYDPFPAVANSAFKWSIYANYTVGVCPERYLTGVFHTGIASMAANNTNLINNTAVLFGLGNLTAAFNVNLTNNYQFWRYELPETEDNHTHFQTYIRHITANYTITAYALEAGGGDSGVVLVMLAVVGGFALMIAVAVLRKK